MKYVFLNYSQTSGMLLSNSVKEASKLGALYVGTEHVLLSMLSINTKDETLNVFCKQLNYTKVLNIVKVIRGYGAQSKLCPDDFTFQLNQCLNIAEIDSKNQGYNKVQPIHLFGALIENQTCTAVEILRQLNLNIAELIKTYRKLTGQPSVTQFQTKNNSKPIGRNIEKYTKNLTKLAIDNKFDPVIGRNLELTNVMQILSRRRKNNPCLVGDPGVGKTAIIEALAQKIALKEVTSDLLGKQILSLDIALMVAGTKYRGDFEERFKNVISEVISSDDIILFIDEIHLIMGAGSAEGGIDACGILKPMLARGEIKLIGATTHSEYKETIEKDSALARRFCKVTIEEPSREDTVNILKGIANKYEIYHSVKLDENIINTAVELSCRYIPEKYLPDKAIDLIDEACVTAFNRLNKNAIDKCITNVTEKDILDVCTRHSGVPIQNLKQNDKQLLCNLEDRLKKKVIGQDKIIKKVCNTLRRVGIGLFSPAKPLASFIFLGPTGVGKTSLAQAIAKEYFGSESSLIRFDMSEYSEQHSVSRLIGAPPGYVGYSQGGQLTQAVRLKPYCVVLFDEIEKAHSDISNILLQILDYGKLTDSDGRNVNFSNVLVIITSNLGAQQNNSKALLGFGTKQQALQNSEKNAMQELKSYFKPELLGRIEDIFVFSQLDKSALKNIAKNMINNLVITAKLNNIYIEYSQDVCNFLSEKVVEGGYGARDINKTIIKYISQPIADMVLQDENNVKKYYIDIINNNVLIKNLNSIYNKTHVNI